MPRKVVSGGLDLDALIVSLLNPTVIGKIELPDPVDWITANFYIPEMLHIKSPPTIDLYPYQRACIREALRRDENGKFIYDTVIWSDLKKSAKTTIASAVTLYRAWHSQYGSFKVVANDQKQAESRVFAYAKTALTMNDKLGSKVSIRYCMLTLPNSTFIEAVPIDPAGEAGGGDDMIEFTELHAAKHKAHQQMFAEMTLSPLKHGLSQRWIDTYAGYSGESPILEPLYDQVVKPENQFHIDDPDAPADLETYRVGRIFCLWNTKPRLYWQTPEYYASEEKVLLPQDFRRMHKNEWTTSVSSFVPREWWLACEEKNGLKEIDRFREVEIALDAAVDDDCFGLIVVSRDDTLFPIRYAKKWIPPPNGKIDFREVEETVKWCINHWNVVELCYDPTQLHDFCMRLRDENIVRIYEFKQGQPRAIADKALRDRIRDRRIVWDKNTEGYQDVTEHIMNANAKSDPLDPKTLRIVKRAAQLKIDLAVCLSMATDRAAIMLSQ